jgi:hypothetical protein
MPNAKSRRGFIEMGAVGACAFLCPGLAAGATAEDEPETRYVFDETMGYCCAECTPEKCAWLGNDMEFKKKKALELSERLGRKIAPEEITCSRCRVAADVAFEAIKGCATRQCVMAKGLLSCAHCPELEKCTRGNPVTRERALAIQRVVLRPAKEE